LLITGNLHLHNSYFYSVSLSTIYKNLIIPLPLEKMEEG